MRVYKVFSPFIAGVGYDEMALRLRVVFKKGTYNDYENVALEDFILVRNNPRLFLKTIRGKYVESKAKPWKF